MERKYILVELKVWIGLMEGLSLAHLIFAFRSSDYDIYQNYVNKIFYFAYFKNGMHTRKIK